MSCGNDDENFPPSSGFPNLYDALEFKWTCDWFLGRQLAQGNGWDGIALAALPFSLTLSGVNTALTPVTGSQRMGVVTLDTGTTAAGLVAVATAATLAMDSGLTPGGIDYEQIGFEAVVGMQNLSTVADEYRCQIGLVGTAPGYDVSFLYDRATYGDFWVASTQEAGVQTTKILDGTGGSVNSPVGAYTFPNTNIVRLGVEYAGTGGVGTLATFKINGTTVWTSAATLPSHSLAGWHSIEKTAGLNVRRMALDYSCLSAKIRSARLP